MIYEPASTGPAAGRCQPGTTALFGACLAWHPAFYSLGCYNDRSIRGSTAPSLHRDGRAFDVGVPLDDVPARNAMDALTIELVLNHERLGVQQVIWDGDYWRVGNSDWRPFTGTAGPHHDHAHVEVTTDAAANLDLLTIVAVLRGMEDFDMTREDMDYLAMAIANAIFNYPVNDHNYDTNSDGNVPLHALLSYGKQELTMIRRRLGG